LTNTSDKPWDYLLVNQQKQIFSLFQMPMDNILDNIFGFMDVDKIPPSEIKKLAWWEYEEYVKRLNDRIDRENKQQKEQQNQQNMSDYSNKMPNMNSIMNNLGKYKK
jgi:hypothetical protein